MDRPLDSRLLHQDLLEVDWYWRAGRLAFHSEVGGLHRVQLVAGLVHQHAVGTECRGRRTAVSDSTSPSHVRSWQPQVLVRMRQKRRDRFSLPNERPQQELHHPTVQEWPQKRILPVSVAVTQLWRVLAQQVCRVESTTSSFAGGSLPGFLVVMKVTQVSRIAGKRNGRGHGPLRGRR